MSDPGAARETLLAAKRAHDRATHELHTALRRAVDNGLSKSEAARLLEMSRPTLYKILGDAQD